MNFIRIALVASSLALVSCAGVPIAEYNEPKNQPTATIITSMGESSWSVFGGFSGSAVNFATKTEAGCYKLHGTPPVPDGQKTVEYLIPAGQEISIHLGKYRGNSRCGGAVFATLEEGQTYRAELPFIGGKCVIQISKINGENETVLELKKASRHICS